MSEPDDIEWATLSQYRAVHSRMRAEHGYTVRALWGSEASQRTRFAALARLFRSRSSFSLLDLGCGFGDFLPFLREQGFTEVDYTGIDINEDLLGEARRRLAGVEFVCGSVREALARGRTFDYAVASGIYNLGASVEQTERLFVEQFKALYPSLRVGFAVNFLSTRSPRPDQVSKYHDPDRVVDLCIREFGPDARLDHSYLPHDFTVLVYR
jgi:SAM-dependent methyltransferase